MSRVKIKYAKSISKPLYSEFIKNPENISKGKKARPIMAIVESMLGEMTAKKVPKPTAVLAAITTTTEIVKKTFASGFMLASQ